MTEKPPKGIIEKPPASITVLNDAGPAFDHTQAPAAQKVSSGNCRSAPRLAG